MNGNDTIVLYSAFTLQDMERIGGCGWWPIGADKHSLSKKGIKYIVCVLNKKSDPRHHSPFLIGIIDQNALPIVRLSKSKNGKARQKIRLAQVADISSETTRKKVPVKRDFYYSSLRSLGVSPKKIHFRPFALSDPDSLQPRTLERKPGKDSRPRGSGTRSKAVWQAREHPLAEKLTKVLKDDHFAPYSGQPWNPDLLMKDDNGQIVLVEIKPMPTRHNIITAIGQIVCYRSPHDDRLINIVASEGKISDDLRKVMDNYRIKGLDMRSRNWPKELQRFLRE